MWSPFICMFATQFFLELISLLNKGALTHFLSFPLKLSPLQTRQGLNFQKPTLSECVCQNTEAWWASLQGATCPPNIIVLQLRLGISNFSSSQARSFQSFPPTHSVVARKFQPISISPSLWDGADDKADGAGGTDYWELEIISLFCTQSHPSLNRQLLTMRQFKVMPHILGSLFHPARKSHLCLQYWSYFWEWGSLIFDVGSV